MKPPPLPSVTPVHVVRRPNGCSIVPAASHYRHLLADLLGILAERGPLWEDLLDLVEGEVPEIDRHLPAPPDRADLLAQRLAEALPGASLGLALPHDAAVHLADQLARVTRLDTARGAA